MTSARAARREVDARLAPSALVLPLQPLRRAELHLVDDPEDRLDEMVVTRPTLFDRLTSAGRVTVVCAPAGSGKTSLLRSWIAETGLGHSVAWVALDADEHDPQRFWRSLIDTVRGTPAGAAVVRELTPSPRLDGAIVERLLEDLNRLQAPLRLVIDDLQRLRSPEALVQLQTMLTRGPAGLRFVISTRAAPRLGLSRLRVGGDLTELRADDLQFTLDEAQSLFKGVGVEPSDSVLAFLHERTEGWAAGLRLAARALCGHGDPERFAVEFCGSERTVAEYLLDEVLDRQSEDVRRLLLRTSIVERINGSLADLLTGGTAGECTLHELEDAGAFVVSLDVGRSWFRCHRLFADLLQLELRRTAPEALPELHRTAAEWFVAHGHPIEAIGHAQAASDWRFATRVVSDHLTTLWIEGRWATVRALLLRFPAEFIAADAELAGVMAADALVHGSLARADRHLAFAAHRADSVPPSRRGQFWQHLAWVRLGVASRRGDLARARRVMTERRQVRGASVSDVEERRAVTLVGLGVAEGQAGRLEDAEGHLEQALTLARRSQRPFLELISLAESALLALESSSTLAQQRAARAVELARRNGWTAEPSAGIAYTVLGHLTLSRGRVEEAEPWLERAERALPAEGYPATEAVLHLDRGVLELARDRPEDALVAFRAAERAAALLATPCSVSTGARAMQLQALARRGEIERVDRIFDEMASQLREGREMRVALAALRIEQNEPEAAVAVLAPVVDGAVPFAHTAWLVEAFLLDAIAHDALRDAGAAGLAVERALDTAERNGLVLPFLLHPSPDLLERHPRHRTSHASLISEILGLLGGSRRLSPLVESDPLTEPLSEAETRVLRYLPTNLSAPEIAGELYLAVSTIKTHIRAIYGKLGAHRRADAVERARAVGLLAPSSYDRIPASS